MANLFLSSKTGARCVSGALFCGALAATTLAGSPRSGGAGSQAAPRVQALRVGGASDLNHDRRVDVFDLLTLGEMLRQPGGPPRAADLNRDGSVNAADFGVLIEKFDNLGGGSSEPPGETPPRFTANLVSDGQKLEVIDNETEMLIVNPTNTKLWASAPGGPNPCLVTPTITLVPDLDGCDLVYTFQNNTPNWSGLGKITVAGVRFDDEITGHDFRFDGKPISIRADNVGIGISGWFYPGGTYSPLNVIEDGPYKMGVSLLYPVLSYQHQVKIRCKSQVTTTGPAWFHEFTLNAYDENKYNPEGDLAPGEVRTYVVAIRFAKGTARWQSTIEPYRRYFQQQYGPVDYVRDPSPVQFTTLAVDGNMAPDNPYGFGGGPSLRPDHYGFAPWVDRLVDRVDRGYSRIMVSKTAGQFYVNQFNNIPPIFASHWLEGAEYGHNMGDALTQFARIPQAGLRLGMWWGRSAQVMPDGWDTWLIEDLSPQNSQHVALAFAELDLAYQAGARLFGLDAFRKMQAWDAIVWINAMRNRAPDARFVTEPVCGDLVHNFAPAFQVATRPANEAELRVETRHFLADLLNPGHEIWGYTRIDRLADFLGREPTNEDWVTEAERVAALGYISCVSEPIITTPGMVAAETWHQDD